MSNATEDEDTAVRVLLAVAVGYIMEVALTVVEVATGEIVTLGVDPIGTSSYKLIVHAFPAMVDLSPMGYGSKSQRSSQNPTSHNLPEAGTVHFSEGLTDKRESPT